MIPDSPIPCSPLVQKFDALCGQFADIWDYVADMRGSLPVRDEPSRAVFSAVSRLTAFFEQMNVLLTLMREDVRLADELTTTAVTDTWSEQIDQRIYEWLRSARPGVPPLH